LKKGLSKWARRLAEDAKLKCPSKSLGGIKAIQMDERISVAPAGILKEENVTMLLAQKAKKPCTKSLL
jgi:hypothetical protein